MYCYGGGAVKIAQQGARTPIINAYTYTSHTLLGPVVLQGLGLSTLHSREPYVKPVMLYSVCANMSILRADASPQPKQTCNKTLMSTIPVQRFSSLIVLGAHILLGTEIQLLFWFAIRWPALQASLVHRIRKYRSVECQLS